MWIRRNAESPIAPPSAPKLGFLKTVLHSFVIIFIAEWGDITQFVAMSLAAESRNPLTVFVASTSALSAVAAIAIIVGYRAKDFVNPVQIKKVSAILLAGFGLWIFVSLVI
jgi:putative Ca2+/H+ antiporter (TMEM165/GDT1 family)